MEIICPQGAGSRGVARKIYSVDLLKVLLLTSVSCWEIFMLNSMREHLEQTVQHAPGANRDWTVQKPAESEDFRFLPVEPLVSGQADTFRISCISTLVRSPAHIKKAFRNRRVTKRLIQFASP